MRTTRVLTSCSVLIGLYALLPACSFNERTPAGHLSGIQQATLRPLDQELLSLASRGAAPDNIKALESLLAQGANPNAQDEDGNTALHKAVQAINAQGFALLVRAQGSLSIQNKSGSTPLMLITNITFSNPFGTPPYMVQAYNDLSKMIETFAQTKSKDEIGLDLQDKNGKTLLMMLGERGILANIEAVLKAGANPDLKDGNGNTAAMIIVKGQVYDYENKLKLLMKYNADLKAKNNDGNNILSIVPNEVSKKVALLIEEAKGRDVVTDILVSKSSVMTHRDSQGNLFLKTFAKNSSDGCSALSEVSRILGDWKLLTEGKEGQSANSQCSCTGNECFLPVEGVAPKAFLDLEGHVRPTDGPNCFNSALYSNGNQTSLRHTGVEELNAYLQSNVCRERASNEAPAVGDIVVISYRPISFGDIVPPGGPIHAFTYLSKDYSFSKDGMSKDIPYSLTYNEEVFRKYNVDASLRKVTQSFIQTYRPDNTPELRKNNGFNYAVYYNCTPNAALATSGVDQSKALASIDKDLASLEKEIAKFLAVTPSHPKTKQQLQKKLEQIQTSLKSLTFKDSARAAGLQQLTARASSFEDQLAMLR